MQSRVTKLHLQKIIIIICYLHTDLPQSHFQSESPRQSTVWTGWVDTCGDRNIKLHHYNQGLNFEGQVRSLALQEIHISFLHIIIFFRCGVRQRSHNLINILLKKPANQ